MASTRAIRRGGAALTAAALAVLITGCSASGTSGNTTTNSITATTSASNNNALTIYVSDPPAVQTNQSLQDVVDAEQLAFKDGKKTFRTGALRIELLKNAKVSDNARDAIADNSIIAYLGEIQQGLSVQTVGITNAEDVLEFSPTDTVFPSKNDYESDSTYGRTFATLAGDLGTTDAALSQADPQFAKSFLAAYGHSPSAQAIEGYVTVRVLLRVLVAARKDAADRQNIVNGVKDTLKANQGSANVANFTITFK